MFPQFSVFKNVYILIPKRKLDSHLSNYCDIFISDSVFPPGCQTKKKKIACEIHAKVIPVFKGELIAFSHDTQTVC